MINYDDTTDENIKDRIPNWPQILNYPYRIYIIDASGSVKANALLNL